MGESPEALETWERSFGDAPPSDFKAAAMEDFIRVSVAKARYFGGAMSLRWWYRQIELGRLPHFRAGATVLLRPQDVEAFVSEGFQPAAAEEPAEEPAEPQAKPRLGRRSLRFFN